MGTRTTAHRARVRPSVLLTEVRADPRIASTLPRRPIVGGASGRRARRLMLAAVLLLGVLALGAYSVSSSTYLAPEAIAKDPSKYVGAQVEVKGTVQPNSVVAQGGVTSFLVTDPQGNAVRVEYLKAMPETFGEGKVVVVKGTIDERGVIIASDILVGCPSRYDPSKDQPER